ncbi:MAG TPA: alpha/beta hydrolase, partial [Thermoanaerobaculia bacterium]
DDVMRRLERGTERWLGVRFAGLSPAELAPSMRTPLLVMHAPEDREMPYEEGELLADRWPGALFRSTPGVGHLRILRDAAVIEQAVAFLTTAS